MHSRYLARAILARVNPAHSAIVSVCIVAPSKTIQVVLSRLVVVTARVMIITALALAGRVVTARAVVLISRCSCLVVILALALIVVLLWIGFVTLRTEVGAIFSYGKFRGFSPAGRTVNFLAFLGVIPPIFLRVLPIDSGVIYPRGVPIKRFPDCLGMIE